VHRAEAPRLERAAGVDVHDALAAQGGVRRHLARAKRASGPGPYGLPTVRPLRTLGVYGFDFP
jgi:hypothetical protein